MPEENIKEILKEYKEETKRHFDVVAESLKHDIQLVAEGVSSVTERVDRMQKDVEVVKDDITTIKINVELIKNELKQKVGHDEFVALERRASLLEIKR